MFDFLTAKSFIVSYLTKYDCFLNQNFDMYIWLHKFPEPDYCNVYGFIVFMTIYCIRKFNYQIISLNLM